MIRWNDWMKKKANHPWHKDTHILGSCINSMLYVCLCARTIKNFTLPHRLVNTLCAIESKNHSNRFFFLVCSSARPQNKHFNFNLMFFDKLQLWKLINTITEPQKYTTSALKNKWRETTQSNVDGGGGPATTTTTTTYLKSLNTLNIVDRWHAR